MSGTFEHIDVPPTLVSFAVDVATEKDIITPELKKAGDKLVWLQIPTDEYDVPVYEKVMDQYGKFTADIHDGKIVAAYALDRHGIVPAVSKMAFGNRMGVTLDASVEAKDLFAPAFGDLIAEVPADKLDGLTIDYTVIGEVTEEQNFEYKDTKIALTDAQKAWESTLESVFATNSKAGDRTRRLTQVFLIQKKYISANTKSLSRLYLFRYFLEQTVSMTVRELLREQEQKQS